MQRAGAITIFHVSRRDGTALFLHPFVKKGTMMDLANSVELIGRYGMEPRVESLTMLRNELYRRIESDVRDWINERRFVPRFLIAAGAFLVVYLFLAAVIRDPLPVLDETLVGLAAGAVTFVLVGRRFEQSKVASQRRVSLRTKVDAVVFSEEPGVHAVEELLHQLEHLEPEEDDYSDSARAAARSLWTEHRELSTEIVSHLRMLVGEKPYRELSKQMKRGRVSAQMRQQTTDGTVSAGAVHLLSLLNKESP